MRTSSYFKYTSIKILSKLIDTLYFTNVHDDCVNHIIWQQGFISKVTACTINMKFNRVRQQARADRRLLKTIYI